MISKLNTLEKAIKSKFKELPKLNSKINSNDITLNSKIKNIDNRLSKQKKIMYWSKIE